MKLTNNVLDLIILNIINLNKDSIITESSKYKNGFLKKIILNQNLNYKHFNDKELNSKFFNIKVEIVSNSSSNIYKLRKYNSAKNKIFKSLSLFISFFFLKYIRDFKDLYLIAYNSKKIIVVENLNMFEIGLLKVSMLLKIRLIISNLLEIVFLITNSKMILNKSK